MSIGTGIVLLLIGLVLVSGAIQLPAGVEDVVETTTLGWILVLVGILALVLSLVAARRTRTARVVEERRVDPR